MRGLRITDDGLFCLLEDAIFYEDNTYAKIRGDFINGFTVDSPKEIDTSNKGWSALYPCLNDNNGVYRIIAGETSWGGTGFIALKDLEKDLFKWVIHLSEMNNPLKINFDKNYIILMTDLNFPDGLNFIIPIDNPEKFTVEIPVTNNSNKQCI